MNTTEAAPAKLNLALHVRRRRPDGYHELETIFAFCGDGDWLSGELADSLSLSVYGPFAAALDGEEDNLVLRAARLLRDAAGVAAAARLTLEKRLPVASGLGGGSADAAAALRLLNRLWQLHWPLERLAALAAGLGADLPACVWSRPMRGEGVGEHLTPVTLDPRPVLLLNPMVTLPTGPVFKAWDGIDRGPLATGDALAASLAGRNDLEPPARAQAPAVGVALGALVDAGGARLVRMSGSGATCFALYDNSAERDAAALQIAATHPDWWLLPTDLLGS